MNLKSTALSAAFVFCATTATAAPILPDASGFGPLTVATFGGTGIPNDAVAQTTFNGVTIGLAATPRFSNTPPVTNDGAGTFFASVGEDTVNTSASSPLSLWNFDFYIGPQSTQNPLNYYSYRFFYDFDPAAGNDQSSHGFINIPGALSAVSAFQNSDNLGANYLSVANVLLGINPPSGATLSTFNPNVTGEYTFKIAAYTRVGLNPYGREVFNTSMLVNVVPEPSQWAILIAGLLALGAFTSRHRGRTASRK